MRRGRPLGVLAPHGHRGDGGAPLPPRRARSDALRGGFCCTACRARRARLAACRRADAGRVAQESMRELQQEGAMLRGNEEAMMARIRDLERDLAWEKVRPMNNQR